MSVHSAKSSKAQLTRQNLDTLNDIGSQSSNPLQILKRVNQVKQQLKETYKKIDSSGMIPTDVFFQIAALKDVKLSLKDRNQLEKECAKQGKIDFNQALSRVTVDMSIDSGTDPLQEPWVLRTNTSSQFHKDFVNEVASKASNLKSVIGSQSQATKQKQAISSAKTKSVLNEVEQQLSDYQLQQSNKENQDKSVISETSTTNTAGPQGIVFSSEKIGQYVYRLYQTDKYLFHKFQQLARLLYKRGIDLRGIDTLRLDIQKRKETPTESELRQEIAHILKLKPQQDQDILGLFIELSKDQDSEEVSMEKINQLLKLVKYWPLIIRKDKNQSDGMQFVMSNQQNSPTASNFQTTPEQRPLAFLLNILWLRITEKFQRIADAYKFFVNSQNQKISFNDLVIGLENLRLDLTTKEIDMIFKALDTNRDGYIDFQEFVQLSEGKRQALYSPKNQVADYEDQQQKDEVSLYDKQSAISLGNSYRIRARRRQDALSSYDCAGIKSLPSDNISDVLCYQFNRLEMIKRIRQKEQEDEMVNLARKTKKLHFRNFQTKANFLRDEQIRSKLDQLNNENSLFLKNVNERKPQQTPGTTKSSLNLIPKLAYRRSSGYGVLPRNNNYSQYTTLEPIRGQTSVEPARIESSNNRLRQTSETIDHHIRSSSQKYSGTSHGRSRDTARDLLNDYFDEKKKMK